MSTLANTPAFPRPASDFEDCTHDSEQDGMTLRQYYAAHAPFPPPDWFEPVFDEPLANKNNGTAIAEQLQRKRKAAFLQWPLAYADALIAELERTAQPPSH